MVFKIMPNELKNRPEISVTEAIGFICLGGPAKDPVEITYIPDEYILELISFHEWTVTHFTTLPPRTLEDVCDEVMETIKHEIMPCYVRVWGKSVVTGKHGMMEVVMEWPGQD